MIRAKPAVEALDPYRAPLEGRRSKLRLDFNENTLGPSPRVLQAISKLGTSDIAAYPEYAGLAAAYAGELGLTAAQVAAFNGVDAAIRAVFDAFGDAGATFLTTMPTFGYYRPCADLQGMCTHAIPYGEGLAFPSEAFASALAGTPRLAFICNPNNPTGTLIPAGELLSLARRAPETLVVVDELYADYTGVSVLPEALALSNVVVLRSLSKSYGLAGLRIGFAVAPPELLDRLTRVVGPYDINSVAVAAAREALADRDYRDKYVQEVAAAKAWTVKALRERGQRVHADGGNYVLVWPDRPLSWVVARLAEHGVLVRSMEGKPLIGDSFRLTIGTCEQMAEFLTRFDSAIAEPPS